MCKSLTIELKRGARAAAALAVHLDAMGGNRATIPVTFNGTSFIVKIDRHPRGPRKPSSKPHP